MKAPSLTRTAAATALVSMLFCLLWVRQVLAAASTNAPSGPMANGVMRYKFATVNENAWCDPRREAEVAQEIARIVETGFNGISIGTYKFMPMYFVNYGSTRYPEAQEFDKAKVAQNVATLRKNIQLAKSKGIQWFIARSYCHYAPYNFWKAHQADLNPGGIFTRLLQQAHQSDIYQKTLAGKDRIIPQQQWANPLFRNFFLDSTAAMLDALPELDGFLNAYAEAAWHYDPGKLKADTWTSWKQIVDYPATDEEFIDYCNSLYRMLKAKRGETPFFGLRDWYVKPETMKRLSIPPKELVISVKYAGYDQPLVNYPPWGKTLQDAGYSVILDMLVFDAEHPHPLYWYDSEMIAGIFRNILTGGFSGVMYQDFSPKGDDSPSNPIRLLTERTVGAAVQGQPFTQEMAAAFLRPYYGPGAEDILVSLKMVSVAQTEMIKLCPAWFWQGDGLTPGGLQTLRFWMLMDNPEAPPGMAFVRQNAVSVKEYVAALRSGGTGLSQAQAAWKKERKETPVEVMDLMRTCADQAIAAARQARRKAPANAPYIQDIVASAVIHKQLVLRDVAFLKAAIAFYKSGAQYDDKYNLSKAMPSTGADERAECVRHLKALIGHDELVRKLCYDYAPRRRQTRSKNDYAFEKKIAAVMGQKLDIPAMDAQELKAMTSLISRDRGR
jgi:hypothetical protein